MEKVTVKFDDAGHFVVAIFTTRIKTAKEMLDITEKLRTEQETGSPFQDFQEELNDAMETNHVRIYCDKEYFTGLETVILELRVIIQKDKECKAAIRSEEIAGTILKGYCNYFGWNPELEGNWCSEMFKDLQVFKNGLSNVELSTGE